MRKDIQKQIEKIQVRLGESANAHKLHNHTAHAYKYMNISHTSESIVECGDKHVCVCVCVCVCVRARDMAGVVYVDLCVHFQERQSKILLTCISHSCVCGCV